MGRSDVGFHRFHFNLLCGDSESSDVALHFNPRFDGRDRVVLNSRLDGGWGSEEKIHKMPFSKGKSFEMAVMINSLGYQVTINTQKHTNTHKHAHTHSGPSGSSHGLRSQSLVTICLQFVHQNVRLFSHSWFGLFSFIHSFNTWMTC